MMQPIGPGPGKPKILGLGLSRTGTTSLTGALDFLDFPTIHYPTSLAQIEAHAGATDVSVLASFKALDQIFPQSRFIVTMRAQESWLESCERLWKKNGAFFTRFAFVMNVEKKVYGGDGFERQRYIDARAHHLSVIDAHFQNRKADLLYLDLLKDPEPWRTLCNFLSVPIPNTPFPNQNRADAVDNLLLKFLESISDCNLLARITAIDEAYIQRLQAARIKNAAPAAVQLTVGFEQMRIVENANAALGLNATAQILDLTPQQLKNYIGH